MGKFEDFTGKIIHRWEFIKRAPDKVLDKRGNRLSKPETMWECRCLECGEIYIISPASIKSGKSHMCYKCAAKQREPKKRKQNPYIINGDVAKIFINDSKKDFFYIDSSDLEDVLSFKWHKSKNGYICTHISAKDRVILHRYILRDELSKYDEKMFVDHINHDVTDNRKCNLRIVTPAQNVMNTNRRNISKAPSGNYYARIIVNSVQIHLGTYKTYEEALEKRREAEDLYFGEFSYENSMKLAEENKLEEIDG